MSEYQRYEFMTVDRTILGAPSMRRQGAFQEMACGNVYIGKGRATHLPLRTLCLDISRE